MLDDLIDHYRIHPGSLIARIYGLFTIKTNRFAPMDLIVMQNTARTKLKNSQTLEFDLKGSTSGRKVKVEHEFWKDSLHQKKGMKDMNLVEMLNNNFLPIDLKRREYSRLKSIIFEDSLFLRKHNIMDYSMLMIIENLEENVTEQSYSFK